MTQTEPVLLQLFMVQVREVPIKIKSHFFLHNQDKSEIGD